MIGNFDKYYSRPEVSNSDLSALKKTLYSESDFDPTTAYKFGNLIDAMITEQHRVDYFHCKVDEEQFSKEDFEKAKRMKSAFFADTTCNNLHKHATGQSVFSSTKLFKYNGIEFELSVRCKFDIWMPAMKWGADIKSTTATTQKQFEDALEYFDYDRQRAFYMDIAESDKDMIIGISKVNYKIFKVPITRDSEIYKKGQEKYLELAFKYWCLFNNFN